MIISQLEDKKDLAMKNYQFVFLTQPELSKKKLTETIETLEEVIDKAGGKVVSKEDWGKHDLTYSIVGNNEAYFWIWQLAFEKSLDFSSISVFLSREPAIIRYLLLKERQK